MVKIEEGILIYFIAQAFGSELDVIRGDRPYVSLTKLLQHFPGVVGLRSSLKIDGPTDLEVRGKQTQPFAEDLSTIR